MIFCRAAGFHPASLAARHSGHRVNIKIKQVKKPAIRQAWTPALQIGTSPAVTHILVCRAAGIYRLKK